MQMFVNGIEAAQNHLNAMPFAKNAYRKTNNVNT